MPTTVTDTETLTRRLRTVTLGGQDFRVPPTATLRYFFWMDAFLKQMQANQITVDDVRDCIDETAEFLVRYNPKENKEKLKQRLTDSCEIADLVTFFNRTFSGQDESEGDERPPRRPRGTSGPNRTARRSRS